MAFKDKIQKKGNNQASDKLAGITPEGTQAEQYNFYHTKWKVVEDHDGNETKIADKITIHYVRFVRLLKSMGFYAIEINKTPFLLKLTGNLVENVDQAYIMQKMIKFIDKWEKDKMPDGTPKEDLMNKIYSGLDTYFKKSLLSTLYPNSELNFIEDTKDYAYFFYRNCYVRVSSSGIETLEYKEKDNLVWKSQILNRDFSRDSKYEQFSFANFCYNIASPGTGCTKEEHEERYNSLRSIIGYNLHKYFGRKLKSTIVTDARITDDPDGRTGKSLLIKAMGRMLNADSNQSKVYCELNGKIFDAKKNDKYNEAEIETKLIHINDLDTYGFFIDSLFSDITEGIQFKKLYKERATIFTKIIISTNKTIKIKGGSARDRVIEFELADYYSEHLSPYDEFKEWFFEWEPDKWNLFDNFMLECVQHYLRNGLQKPISINLDARKLREQTSLEFVDFMTDRNIEFDWRYEKKALFNEFRERYPDFAHDKFKQKTFTSWLRDYASYTPTFKPFDSKESSYNEPRANGKDYIIFRKWGDNSYLQKKPTHNEQIDFSNQNDDESF